MKDETIGVWHDPEVEVRIVAMVLGEASDFEKAELERMIAEDSGLKQFYVEMSELHGGIHSAVQPDDDAEWKLSSERRNSVLEKLGQQPEPVASTPMRKASNTTRQQWRSFMSIAACLLITLFIMAVMFPVLRVTKNIKSPSEIISYSSYEENEEVLQTTRIDELKRAGAYKYETSNDPFADDSVRASVNPSSGKSSGFSEDYGEPIDRLEITEEVARKPSAPSSSMAKVIASSSASPTAVPVPNITVTKPSIDFGNGDDFGDGWADGKDSSGGFGTRGEKKALAVKHAEIRQSNTEQLDFDWVSDSSNVVTDGNGLISKGTERLKESRSRNVRSSFFSGSHSITGSMSLQESKDSPSDESEFKNSKSEKVRESLYLSSYDNTRAELLTEVDKGWEIAVPPTVDFDSRITDGRKTNKTLGDVPQSISSKKVKRLNGVVILNEVTALEISSKDVGKPESGFEKGNLKKLKPKVKQLEKKKENPVTEEISAADQTHSTFSLNVSDASYKLAKAALLEHGEWPAAESVRTEEFINAFDYGDPKPSMAQKVACVQEQAVHPFAQQRNLLRVSMSTAAQGRSTPLNIVVLLDQSGSMERPDRAATVLRAMEELGKQLGPNDRVSLMSFARETRLLVDDLSGDRAGELVKIMKNRPSEGGTNLEQAVQVAQQHLLARQKKGVQSRIVVLTDGAANLGNANPENMTAMVEKMRDAGIAFDACGIGFDGLDDGILEALTRKGDGRYYVLDKPEDAGEEFGKQIAGALRPAAKNVKVQLVFNPDRVGKYKLLGFEKHRLKKEDFRNDAVDAAEMAAEESGSALYQIEPMADGSGAIGTVFVRFQDMATGQMVERSWTIPYQQNTPSLAAAKPSIQLAAVAGLLGEKLHQSDAGSVDFSQMNEVLGNLNSQYSGNKKVQELLQMVRKVQQ